MNALYLAEDPAHEIHRVDAGFHHDAAGFLHPAKPVVPDDPLHPAGPDDGAG